MTRLQKKLESYQKILPGQHAVQKLKCQLNRSYEIASPDVSKIDLEIIPIILTIFMINEMCFL